MYFEIFKKSLIIWKI